MVARGKNSAQNSFATLLQKKMRKEVTSSPKHFNSGAPMAPEKWRMLL
jgi:hypothetical protein